MSRGIWPLFLLPFASGNCALVDAASSLAGIGESQTAEESNPPAAESTELPPEQRARIAGQPPFAWDLEALGKACGYDKACNAETERQKRLCEKQKLTGIPEHSYAPHAAYDICRDEFDSQEQELAPFVKKYEEKKKADRAIAEKAEAEAAKAKEESTTVVPRAVRRDASVERVIAAGYTADGEKVFKVLLTDDWEMVRAPTGLVTGRAITAHIVSRVKDGCRLTSAYWLQEHDGRTFTGPVRFHQTIDRKWLACDKLR